VLYYLEQAGHPYDVAALGHVKFATPEAFACHASTAAVVHYPDDLADAQTAVDLAGSAAVHFDGFAQRAESVARQASSPGGLAMRTRLVDIVHRRQDPLPAGHLIPYLRLPDLLTVSEVARLWTITDEDQLLAFARLADVVRREKRGEEVEPVRMLISGKPGTGKSRVLQALQWYTLQLDAVDMLAVVAYTWRAALLLGTPDNAACTTSTFYAIDCHHTPPQQLRNSGKVRLASTSGYCLPVRDRSDACTSVQTSLSNVRRRHRPSHLSASNRYVAH
jgi:hypothetical protein